VYVSFQTVNYAYHECEIADCFWNSKASMLCDVL